MRLTFRVGLVAALVGLLLATVGVIVVPSYRSVHATAESLSFEVLAQAIGRVDAHVASQLDVAEEEDREDALRVERGQLSMDDPDAVGAELLDGLAAHAELTYLSLARDATGEIVTAQRTPTGELALHVLRAHDGGQLELSDYAVAKGKRTLTSRVANKPENDPRSRPYYAFVRDARAPTWTDSTEFVNDNGVPGTRGVSHVTPVRRADGSLAFALTADFDLHTLAEFLGRLRILEHGVAYLVEYRRDGSQQVLARGTDDQGLAAAMLATLPKTLPTSAPATPIRFAREGRPYVGAFRPVARAGLHWVVVAVAPEEDVFGEMHRSDRLVLAIIAVSLVAALALALLLAGAIARPLRALADDAAAVSRFELDTPPAPPSRIKEVATLATAMEEMKRGLRSFKKFVPADLVRDILASGKDAGVSGKRTLLTIHFSDIAGFTTLSEKLPAEDLVASLVRYLEEMTAPIVQSGGTVDKYIGDAIMAFWGAPRPDTQHALHACQAALANQKKLDALNDAWQRDGKPRLEARVALHTGEAVVGNIGGDARLNYTIIGDAVNLASRLEGLNKAYGTRLMISESTYKEVAAVMLARPIDRVAVKGKERGIDVYELVGTQADASDTERQAVARHAEAFAFCMSRRWLEAAAILRERVAAVPTDEPARILLARCERFAVSPPPDDWDGTERMTSK